MFACVVGRFDEGGNDFDHSSAELFPNDRRNIWIDCDDNVEAAQRPSGQPPYQWQGRRQLSPDSWVVERHYVALTAPLPEDNRHKRRPMRMMVVNDPCANLPRQAVVVQRISLQRADHAREIGGVEMIEDTDPKSGPLQHGYEATEMSRDPTQGRGKWSENENVEDTVVV